MAVDKLLCETKWTKMKCLNVLNSTSLVSFTSFSLQAEGKVGGGGGGGGD